MLRYFPKNDFDDHYDTPLMNRSCRQQGLMAIQFSALPRPASLFLDVQPLHAFFL